MQPTTGLEDSSATNNLRIVNQLTEVDLGDATPIEAPFRISGKRYLVKSAPAAAAAMWQNFLVGKATFDPETGQPTKFAGAMEAQHFLLSMCMVEAETQIPVTIVTIKQWPNKIVQPLCDKLFEISELSTPETEQALTKQLETIEKKLDKLRAAKENGREPAKVLGND